MPSPEEVRLVGLAGHLLDSVTRLNRAEKRWVEASRDADDLHVVGRAMRTAATSSAPRREAFELLTQLVEEGRL